MSKSKKLIRGTALLTGGQLASYGFSFIRNMLLARLLNKEDYALTALFGTAVTLLEISGRMAFGKQVIQAEEGDDVDFQASAHTLQFLGGLFGALLIAACAIPMANMMRVPQTAWAFALLGVIPFSQGLTHLDISRRQRDLDYTPFVIIDVATQFVMVVLVWPLTKWFGDYRVILVLMVGKAVIGTIISYFFSDRPYRFGFKREYVQKMLTFGWPLLITGLLIFGSQQLDQIIVGKVFSLAVLAVYTTAFSLVSIPWMIFGQVMSSIMLPIMARAQANPLELRQQYRICALTSSVAGIVCLLPMIVAGEPIITILFGAKYANTGPYMAILGAAAALRFLRYTPAIAAMARGDTLNQLYSNLWRITSLPLALMVWHLNGNPLQIAACAVAGEVFAVGASIVRLSTRQGIPIRESYAAVLYITITLAIGVTFSLLYGAKMNIWVAGGASAASVIAALIAARFVFPEAANFVFEVARRKLAVGNVAPVAS